MRFIATLLKLRIVLLNGSHWYRSIFLSLPSRQDYDHFLVRSYISRLAASIEDSFDVLRVGFKSNYRAAEIGIGSLVKAVINKN